MPNGYDIPWSVHGAIFAYGIGCWTMPCCSRWPRSVPRRGATSSCSSSPPCASSAAPAHRSIRSPCSERGQWGRGVDGRSKTACTMTMRPSSRLRRPAWVMAPSASPMTSDWMLCSGLAAPGPEPAVSNVMSSQRRAWKPAASISRRSPRACVKSWSPCQAPTSPGRWVAAPVPPSAPGAPALPRA